MLGNRELRNLLDAIVSDENSENWWRPELFEKNTRHQLPNDLTVVEAPPEESRNYNCFVFAFDLRHHTPLLGVDGWEYTRRLGTTVDTLIDDKSLELLDTPTPDSLVVYRTESGTISHVGRITPDGKVISKWSWGPLLEHDLYAVPASYGDMLEYYSGIKKGQETILRDFLQSSPS